MAQGQPSDYGPPSTIVVEIPGVGNREFPASMPPEQIQAQALQLMQRAQPAGAMPLDDPRRYNTTPPAPGKEWLREDEARVRGFAEGAKGAADRVLTPETVAGLSAIPASRLGPGGKFAIPPAVGAATSVVRDVLHGQRDPATVGLNALTHGTINAAPGLLELPLGAGGSSILGLASKLRGVGPIAKGLQMIGLGNGPVTSTGTAAMASPLGDLATATLPSGVKLASKEGLTELVRKSVDLTNNGGNPATINAIDKLIEQVRQHLRIPPTSTQALSSVGMAPTTARAAQAAASQTTRGRISGMLRALLAGVSEGQQ